MDELEKLLKQYNSIAQDEIVKRLKGLNYTIQLEARKEIWDKVTKEYRRICNKINANVIERDIIRLHVIGRWTYKDIAKYMHYSHRWIEKAMSNIRKKLIESENL
jgi:predicted DNA-binding protein (UPF0251 family)